MFEKLNSSVEPVFVEYCRFIFYDVFVVPYYKFCNFMLFLLKLSLFLSRKLKCYSRNRCSSKSFFINVSLISQSNIRELPVFFHRLLVMNIFHWPMFSLSIYRFTPLALIAGKNKLKFVSFNINWRDPSIILGIILIFWLYRVNYSI